MNHTWGQSSHSARRAPPPILQTARLHSRHLAQSRPTMTATYLEERLQESRLLLLLGLLSSAADSFSGSVVVARIADAVKVQRSQRKTRCHHTAPSHRTQPSWQVDTTLQRWRRSQRRANLLEARLRCRRKRTPARHTDRRNRWAHRSLWRWSKKRGFRFRNTSLAQTIGYVRIVQYDTSAWLMPNNEMFALTDPRGFKSSPAYWPTDAIGRSQSLICFSLVETS
jgi:hypothetical protein